MAGFPWCEAGWGRGAWVGVKDSDIMAARRLGLFRAPAPTGPLLFQRCVGSRGSHVLEIIRPRAAADGVCRR